MPGQHRPRRYPLERRSSGEMPRTRMQSRAPEAPPYMPQDLGCEEMGLSQIYRAVEGIHSFEQLAGNIKMKVQVLLLIHLLLAFLHVLLAVVPGWFPHLCGEGLRAATRASL